MGVGCSACEACWEEVNKRTRFKNNNNDNSVKTYSRGPQGHDIHKFDKIDNTNNVGGTGSSCYTCEAKINQRPETGRDDFRIQINARHNGDHSCDEQILTIVFNHPATFISCSNGSLNGGNNTTKIEVKLRYHNNQNDNIGMGDFIVKSTHNDLEILSCYINDGH